MSGESSKRSNLIDVTYSNLHSILSGQVEGISDTHLLDILIPRFTQLGSISDPFGTPTPASREKIKKGSVVLQDGVLIRLEEPDKEFVYAISKQFGIDEVHACVLFRSFLYNEGLPAQGSKGDSEEKGIVEELLEAITPFYHAERLYVIRALLPLFRAQSSPEDAWHGVATEILPKILPDGRKFAQSIIKEYLRKTQAKPPAEMNSDPKTAGRWAKQNAKEQLLFLELLFWTMWSHVPCDGPLVLQIYEAAYSTNLGAKHSNVTLLLDEESSRIQQDCAALWILITIEVLELENVAEGAGASISDRPQNPDFYISSPTSLEKIHELVTNNDGTQHACAYLAWAFVLARIAGSATQMSEVPDSYRTFLRAVVNPAQGKDRDPMYTVMAKMCLDPSTGLFQLLGSLLTQSPVFVTSVSWHRGSTITDPNAVAFRSVIKGLLIALLELVPVELIPDFPGLVEVWTSLFGRSEPQSIAGITTQFWTSDYPHSIARRALFDVARSRFPIHARPLLRLLRAQTGLGFLDTDPLGTVDHVDGGGGGGLTEERALCARHVFYFFEKVATFSTVVPLSECAGPQALYERVLERYGTATGTGGLSYQTLKPIVLPGGSTMPAKTKGTVLSNDGGEVMVVCWAHEHSGWKLILDVLRECVGRVSLQGGDVAFKNRWAGETQESQNQKTTLSLEEIGAEGMEETELIIDILDLLRSVMQDNPVQTEQIVEALEAGSDPSSTQSEGLVQVITMILESSLSNKSPSSSKSARTRLITSAMSVLSALLPLPSYSTRVWLYIRSTPALFGHPDRPGTSFASVALSAERMTGHYTMTLALLHLVQQLFHQAASTVLVDGPKLASVKEDVLLRAVRFVHTEIWVEHAGWKYAQMGDRFEIGRRVTGLYADILSHSPAGLEERPFPALAKAIVDVMLGNASSSSAVGPLVTALATGGSTLKGLYKARRYDDARRMIFLLEGCLSLVRVVLGAKGRVFGGEQGGGRLVMLEQALCTRVSGGFDSNARFDPIDVLAGYVKERDMGGVVPLEAARVLGLLCASFGSTQMSVIGHLGNAERIVQAFVRIVQHPYDELELRNAVWRFIGMAVDREPAMATLFVTGRHYVPPVKKALAIEGEKEKGKGKEDTASATVEKKEQDDKKKEEDTGKPEVTAMHVAVEVVETWREMWDVNPRLLVSVMRFLDVVWQHGLEHTAVMKDLRKDDSFWDRIGLMASEETGPSPDYQPQADAMDGETMSDEFVEGVAAHAYRVECKSHALRILAADLDIHFHESRAADSTKQPPLSFYKMEQVLQTKDQFQEQISEATPSSYDPELHDMMVVLLKTQLPGLTLEQLEQQDAVEEREYGGNFMYSTALLQGRLMFSGVDLGTHSAESIHSLLRSINLNLSLNHTQNMLVESWQGYLQKAVPFLRGKQRSAVRENALHVAADVAAGLAGEKRLGDMMATVYGLRLALVLALVEVAWFPGSEEFKKSEVMSFVELVQGLHGVVTNEPQAVSRSFLGIVTVPFHRTLLQIIYYCARCSRDLVRRPKTLNADHRLTVSAMLEVSLALVADALRVVLVSARSRYDMDLDRDMELLVSVFEQCTLPELNMSPAHWLMRCQELDLIQASLELFAHADLVGLSDIQALVSRKGPYYAPHLLLFHMILANIPQSAEKLASDGVLSAYSNNILSAALSSGLVDVVIPELPSERSPAHSAYCSMLSVVSAVVTALGRHNHYFDAEACALVQLYGQQISRCLSWTINEPITLPLLEELEQTVSLFHSIAESTPHSASKNPVVEKVLRGFTARASMLLQQINYALTHPNHLASLIEPVNADERSRLEKEQGVEDPRKRPLVGSIMGRLFRLAGNVLATFVSVTRAFDVLITDQEEWALREVLIVPHSKVVVGESASLGTLFELSNSTLDALRDALPGAAAPKALGPPKPIAEPAADTNYDLRSLRQLLEAALLYSVTQLTIFLSNPDEAPDAAGGDMDLSEDHLSMIERAEEKRGPRQSLTLGERLKRGMTGEMVADLQGILGKAKGVLEQVDKVLEKEKGGGQSVDISGVLLVFLNEHALL